MDNIQPYRQPIVTASGILLGFVLNFTSNWMGRDISENKWREIFTVGCLISSITLLLIVLYRILNMDYPVDKVRQYYKRTLLLFILGMSIPFGAIIVFLAQRFGLLAKS